MPRTLIVPGVSVEARFDVPPPLPARSGILGAVGVVDRIPPEGVKAVTTTQELLDIFGPATRFSFPEALAGLVNGVSELVVSPVPAAGGVAASARLLDDEAQEVAILRARAVGPWGNHLSVRITRNLSSDRRTVRRITLEVLHKGRPVERHDNLVLRPGDDNDFFTVINRDSGTIVAVDPNFEEDLPVNDPDLVSLINHTAAAATGRLTVGGGDLIQLTAAAAGEAGNFVSFETRAGHALATLNDAGNQPSLRIRAREAGAAGTGIRITIADSGAGGVNVTVEAPGNPARAYNNQNGIAALVQALASDPAILAERAGNLLPAVTPVPVALAPTVTVTIREEGVRTVDYADHANATALTAALDSDPGLTAQLVGPGDSLPDEVPANTAYLTGGRDAGWARRYAGRNNPAAEILEIRAVESVAAERLRIRFQNGSETGTARLTVGLQFDTGFEQQELHDNLSMDPDHPRYLQATLAQESAFVRAIDLYRRERSSHWPAATASPRPLQDGAVPPVSGWQTAIDRLSGEDAVDLVLAGLQEFGDPNLNGVAVQQALVAHARTQADNAKPRIALLSIQPGQNEDIAGIIEHAGQVADRRSVLVAPAGADGALAGLLGHLEYFQSPTFKTIALPGVPLVQYTESELNKLVGPEGNVCVITQRRGRGTICVKGIATDGFQISVVRVADRCIREVKKISDKFIGELNNENSRTALKQMIVAVFTQMERDGALVPSVDGSSPAFEVEVYASQNDVAAGNARIDIAVRPVRAIDYIYATIRVKN
ncbi:MAG: phage tail sheath C-terminal domain-containing protein [Bryobacteraceae bacterium]